VDSRVTLRVFNVLGQEVKTLVDEVEPAGYKSGIWDSKNNAGNGVASGVYFYRIDAASVAPPLRSFTQTRKMLLVK
jgi:flagellar hook assembly protein FlgD